MSFSETFSNAWKEFSDNFLAILYFALAFYIVPLVVMIILLIIIALSAGFSIASTQSLFGPVGILAGITALIVFLAFIACNVFMNAGIYGISVKQRKYKFKDLVNSGKKSFWRFLGRSILLGLLLLLLFILLIIPGIIFCIYWIFAPLIWFNEAEKGFGSALKRSRELVKGRWWRTLGYVILFVLILIAVNIVASFVPFVGGVIGVFTSIFMIYFLRHLYISYSSDKVKVKKRKK